MTREEILKKYADGFVVRGKKDYETIEWALNTKETTSNCIRFWGYDSGFMPLSNFSNWSEKAKNKSKAVALNVTKGFKGEVWLDDVKIKG